MVVPIILLGSAHGNRNRLEDFAFLRDFDRNLRQSAR